MVRAASSSAGSIDRRPSEIVTSGRVTRKTPWDRMVALIRPYMPNATQNTRKPSAVMTGGSMKGATPNV